MERTHGELRRAAGALLLGVALLAVAVECGTRLFVYRMSASLGRIRKEAAAATRLRRLAEGPRQVLIVGNSLLMEDVDMAELNSGLEPHWQATRFAIEQTTYYDWHFGLRRLLAAGARPDAIVLCVEPRHLIAPGVRNEIFAYFLLQPSDIYTVSRMLRLTPTETSDLVFANASASYALRKEIRKNLLGRLMPSLPDLTAMITRGGLPPPNPARLSSVGKSRLEATRDVVTSADSRLLLVLTPPLGSEDSRVLRTVGDDLGVPVVAPFVNDNLTSSDFDRDGYHLSEEGRLKFTRTLIPSLMRELNLPDAHKPALKVQSR